MRKAWTYLLLIGAPLLVVTCADLAQQGPAFSPVKTDRGGVDFSARLTISNLPEDFNCLVFNPDGSLAGFDNCQFEGEMTGDLNSESYLSHATGLFAEGITAVHTIVGCIDGAGCGTLEGDVSTAGPGQFNYDMRGISGDLEETRILGLMIEDFNDTPAFDFDVEATLFWTTTTMTMTTRARMTTTRARTIDADGER